MASLDFEADVEYVAVFDGVLFALQAHLSGGLGLVPAATGGGKILEIHRYVWAISRLHNPLQNTHPLQFAEGVYST